MQLPAFFHKKSVLVVVVIIGFLLYAGLNVWLFMRARQSATPATSTTQASPRENPSTQSTRLPTSLENQEGGSPSTPKPTPTLAPTPTPLQGPGRFACDPLGICNDYGDEERKSCTVTFADRGCLNQCGDTAKRCTM